MKRALIVTGASRGIGAAVALRAAQHGYPVCINYRRNRDKAERLCQTIEAGGGRAISVAADVSEESDVERLFQVVDRDLGALGGLVNNVGILDVATRVDAMDAARVLKILTTNVLSAFLCSREATRRMSTRYGGTGGAIVNVSSAASRLGSAGEYVDYAASKGAIDSLTIGHAEEVAAEGIRVNCVRPGFIHTDIHATSGDANRIERLERSIPMQRGGTPEEVANAILWLLSDEASFVTGSFIDLAGGK